MNQAIFEYFLLMDACADLEFKKGQGDFKNKRKGEGLQGISMYFGVGVSNTYNFDNFTST